MVLLKHFHPVKSEPQLKEAFDTLSVTSNKGQSETPRSKELMLQCKAVIGKSASEHGITKAVCYFKQKDLKKSSVQDWKKAYEFRLLGKQKSTKPCEAAVVNKLDGKKS